MLFQTLPSVLLTLLLGTAGLYCMGRGGNVFFTRPHLLLKRKVEKKTTENQDAPSPLGALCVALGGTIGVGNTVGVASAVCLGGAGTLFWMWVSGFLGMALKYAEVYLSHLHRDEKGHGGAHILLKKKKRTFLCALFCISCILVAFGMGNLAQSSGAAAAAETCLSIPPLFCGAALMFICFFVLAGGMRRLTRFSVFCIPLSSFLFLFLCMAVLFVNRENLPQAIKSIFTEAFSFRAAAGGFAASLFCRALTAGFSRGLFSNEAGLGSAPLVHSEAKNTAEEQGKMGAREVVLDTHVICTLTAFVLLSSPAYIRGERESATLCFSVFFEALGHLGTTVFALCLFLFAAASILAWGHYGKRALNALLKKKNAEKIYYLFFFAVILLGSLLQMEGALILCDWANALMAAVNLYALFLYRKDLRFPK